MAKHDLDRSQLAGGLFQPAREIGGKRNYETSYYSDALNTAQYRIPAHGFANAFVDFETNDHHWNFTVTARNLANAFYFTRLTPVGSGIKSGAYAGTILLKGAQNSPRTVFFKVSYLY